MKRKRVCECWCNLKNCHGKSMWCVKRICEDCYYYTHKCVDCDNLLCDDECCKACINRCIACGKINCKCDESDDESE